MKKLLLLTLISFSVLAQKKRTVVFDADTTTRPAAGFYGIGIRDSQPYLVSNTGNNLMIDVSKKNVEGWQFNASGAAPTNVKVLAINKDSLTIDLPDASDTLNKNLQYNLIYFGFQAHGEFNQFDNTYLVSLSDTVFFDYNNVTYSTLSFSSAQTNWFFKITPYSGIGLYVNNKRWYLRSKDFKF